MCFPFSSWNGVQNQTPCKSLAECEIEHQHERGQFSADSDLFETRGSRAVMENVFFFFGVEENKRARTSIVP